MKKLIRKQKKREKLDPDNYKSVPQILKEKGTNENSGEGNGEGNGEDNGEDNGENSGKKVENSNTNGKVPIIAGFSSTGLKDREEIKKKLMKRIDDLRKKRKSHDEIDGERQIKRQRTNNNTNNNKKRRSSFNETAKKPINTSNDSSKNGSEHIKNNKNEKVENDRDEDIEYGTFDFSSDIPIPTYLSHKKKGPDKKNLLQKAMEKQRLLEELKDTEEGKTLKKDDAWNNMMKRAQGEKVKDDPKKLKKSIKRVESKKTKSKKQWDTRLKQQKKKRNQVIKRRESNIQKRIQRKRGVVKGNRPGFEGKNKKL